MSMSRSFNDGLLSSVATEAKREWKNLMHVADYPGRWGSLMSCMLALGWALALWDRADAIEEWKAVDLYATAYGSFFMAIWMTICGLLPIFAIATSSTILRAVSATLLLSTWGALLIETLATWEHYRPAMMTCLVGLMGAYNSDVRLWRSFSASERRRGN